MPVATVSTSLFQLILRRLQVLKFDSGQILKELSLTETEMNDIDGRLPLDTYERLWLRAIGLTNDERFGFNLGLSLKNVQGGHLLHHLVMACPTIGKVLEKTCAYHDLMSDHTHPAFLLDDVYCTLVLKKESEDKLVARHMTELFFCMIVQALRALSKSEVPIQTVHFQHSQENIEPYQDFFKAPIFDNQQQNQLIFKRADLELPVFSSNPNLLKMLEGYADQLLQKLNKKLVISKQVTKILTEIIQGDVPTLDVIAGRLGIGVRTLQDQLRKEGTTYQQLLDQVRKEISLDLLGRNTVPIVDIAFLLGYSEQSVFSHAFKKWTGRTPMQYRKGNS